MSGMECEPCNLLDKKNSAVQWCISCHERLCLECSSYHRALTATKDHSLITTKQYEAILPILTSVETKCCHHSEKDLEYVCKEHECFCCIICKREKHVDCRKVEKIEEIISETDLMSELKNMSSRCEHAGDNLSKLTYSTDVNMVNLDKAKNEIFHQMQIHRVKINHALDTIENDIKQEINKSFKTEKNKLQKQRNEYTKKKSEIEKEQEMIHTMLETDIKSNKHLFLVQRNIQDKLNSKELLVENFVSSFQIIASNCRVGTSIDKESGSVKFTKTIEFNRNHCKFDLHSFPTEDENDETASSTVEAEEMVPLDKFQKKRTDTKIPDFIISPVSTNYTFKYKRNIVLASTNANSNNAHFIKSISKKYVVVWALSEKYLLFYNTESMKENKIYLQFPPSSIAIIDEKTIAITACREIVFVNTQRFTYMHTVNIDDDCFGIAFMRNQLFVNCESKGLKVMDVKGNISKSFEEITGKLQLCVLNRRNIAVTKQGCYSIIFLNISTSSMRTIDLPGSEVPNCMSSFGGNILLVTTSNNQVFQVNIDYKNWRRLIKAICENDQLYGIEFDKYSNELYLMNKNGCRVYILGR
ncbi:uncharacterized protein LOC127733385 [Mytilus californianus]|uniref:uncharacterized protein LOC127733385 n=1 Tax=Mytilus californianus TaxID=6549 RepID=UPI002247C962|nr:uncharacterized protein LOC127733385 [Mytilus californianus]